LVEVRKTAKGCCGGVDPAGFSDELTLISVIPRGTHSLASLASLAQILYRRIPLLPKLSGYLDREV